MTVAASVPPAVPAKVTSAPVKPVTGSLNTTVKLIGDAVGRIGLARRLVDRHRRRACRRKVTVLSVLVEAVLAFPAASWAAPAAIVAITVPLPVMPRDGDVVGRAAAR